jgi:acetyl esterase
VPLDPQVRELLDQMAAAQLPPLEEQSVADVRAGMARMTALAESAEVAGVEELGAPTARGEVPVRLYRPPGPAAGPHPMLVWFHGGGWVLGDLGTADPTARDLCARSGTLVASVDYPLAPEHPFPAAPEACFEVTRWLADHAPEVGADPGRLAVGGDSAGGNLAAVCALLARDRDGPTLSFQLLVYPVTDCLGSFPSVTENGDGYFLTADAMLWCAGHYLPADADRKDPAASPIYASDLSGLPPALVVTAEFDPLRDEGEAYARRLEDAGVSVTASRYNGMVHGFFGMTAVLDEARRAMAEAADALRAALYV